MPVDHAEDVTARLSGRRHGDVTLRHRRRKPEIDRAVIRRRDVARRQVGAFDSGDRHLGIGVKPPECNAIDAQAGRRLEHGAEVGRRVGEAEPVRRDVCAGRVDCRRDRVRRNRIRIAGTDVRAVAVILLVVLAAGGDDRTAGNRKRTIAAATATADARTSSRSRRNLTAGNLDRAGIHSAPGADCRRARTQAAVHIAARRLKAAAVSADIQCLPRLDLNTGGAVSAREANLPVQLQLHGNAVHHAECRTRAPLRSINDQIACKNVAIGGCADDDFAVFVIAGDLVIPVRGERQGRVFPRIAPAVARLVDTGRDALAVHPDGVFRRSPVGVQRHVADVWIDVKGCVEIHVVVAVACAVLAAVPAVEHIAGADGLRRDAGRDRIAELYIVGAVDASRNVIEAHRVADRWMGVRRAVAGRRAAERRRRVPVERTAGAGCADRAGRAAPAAVALVAVRRVHGPPAIRGRPLASV